MKNLRVSLFVFLAICLLLAGCSRSGEEGTAEGTGGKSGRAAKKSLPPPLPPILVPSGTTLEVRLIDSLSSKDSAAGDTFRGTLEKAVEIDGKVAFAKGADVTGKVTKAVPSGRLRQRAELWVTITAIEQAGKNYAITASTTGHKEGSKATRDILLIGGGAGAGAAIGGIAGGGKGAGLGAAIGAGAGTVGAMMTGKKDIRFPSETVLRFTLSQDVQVRP